jgi:hypothetical protein
MTSIVRLCTIIFLLKSAPANSITYPAAGNEVNWQAQWITASQNQDKSNTWLCFRKDFNVVQIPDTAIALIAADTKYWLWINGRMVIFEGGLKRGPTPEDTYYDEVNIAEYLKPGENTVAVLTWYFGKNGFSHISSGKAGFLFQCITPLVNIVSDRSWIAAVHPAFENTVGPEPNFRLSESNIRFDARKDISDWQDPQTTLTGLGFSNAQELGKPPVEPWNNLIRRPIPQWKDLGLKDYNKIDIIYGCDFDTVVCDLPYNAQITPFFRIEAPEGLTIKICTDNFYVGNTANIRAEYVTTSGEQSYESRGWINGHKVFYIVPHGIEIRELKYRETGYNTEFAGSFSCSDPFFNRLWEKARRTLYVTMRDNYMDCPDRERAQWIGDMVTESGETFYALDTKSSLLTRKCLYEFIGRQRPDKVLYAPVPAGNWKKELPSQSLTAIGYYGLWNYYLYTGDLQTIRDLYENTLDYLKLWKLSENGTVVFRAGDWTWGDWGDNIDIELMYNPLYYLALKGVKNMAEALARYDDATFCEEQMILLKNAFNEQFWTGKEYRSKDYDGRTDDRCQALAVVAGMVEKEKYPAILEIFKNEEHASPYMEKYIMEALFIMGFEEYALERTKRRFEPMANNHDYSTLFEGWDIRDKNSAWTVNHAWSGGSLTVLSQYLCGIAPVKPGFKQFAVKPQPGSISSASAKLETVTGAIESSFTRSDGKFILNVSVPEKASAIISVPRKEVDMIRLNGNKVWYKGQYKKSRLFEQPAGNEDGYVSFIVNPGKWELVSDLNNHNSK